MTKKTYVSVYEDESNVFNNGASFAGQSDPYVIKKKTVKVEEKMTKNGPVKKTVTEVVEIPEVEPPADIVDKEAQHVEPSDMVERNTRVEETPNGAQIKEVVIKNDVIQSTKILPVAKGEPAKQANIIETVEERVIRDPRNGRLPPRRRARTPYGGGYGDRRRSRPDPRRRGDGYGYERERYARRSSRGPSRRSSRGPGYGRYGRRY